MSPAACRPVQYTILVLTGVRPQPASSIRPVSAASPRGASVRTRNARLLGVLAGGAPCVRYLRSAIADDIGAQFRRMHADVDPQLRRMQNQLDNIESAVNLAVISRYTELSQLTWPAAVPAQRAADSSQG